VEDLARRGLEWADAPTSAQALAYVHVDRPQAVELWESLGFVQIGVERFLGRDLVHLPRPPLLSLEGIEVTTLDERPDLIDATYPVYRDGILAIPGEATPSPPDLETWKAAITSEVEPRSTRFVALESGDVVG